MNELQMNQNDGHGGGQPPNKVFCSECGHGMSPKAPNCPSCGAPKSLFLIRAWCQQLSCAFSSARLAFIGSMSVRSLPAF